MLKKRRFDKADIRAAHRQLRVHAAQRSVDLMAEICQIVAHRDKPRVLDPFAGSGSTLIGARRCGFSSVGVEQCESIATKRLRAEPLLAA